MSTDRQDQGQRELDFSIIDATMTVQAMRDSGYKSTTHALAELIDNSIESEADSIEVFGLSRFDTRTNRWGLQELAVLDNGRGMDRNTLRGALRYGHGTRRERHGIGRFGLGLPNSSMSQARRLDVWSWQSGPTNALHTYLHLDDVENGATEIPEPTMSVVPDKYLQSSRIPSGAAGTLVLWSDLDRVEWTRASTTFKHTENLLGRVYRRFLAKESERLYPQDDRGDEIGPRRSITLIPIDDHEGDIDVLSDDIVEVRPNDPLYLFSDTSCPEDFGDGPMFMELPGFSPMTVPVTYQGQTHTVRMRASYARPHVRDPAKPGAAWPEQWQGQDAGRTPWGKHAAQNSGVSLMRAHREIQLDDSWVSHDDPRERWWTIEVDFPTALDEVFGVTNNKQGTMTFQRLAAFDWRREALEGEDSSGDVRRRMEADGDPRAFLLHVQEQIHRCRTAMRVRVRESRQSRRGHDSDASTEESTANRKATAAIRRRKEEGHQGESDIAAETGTPNEHKQKQVDSLVQRHHLDRDDALQRVDDTIRTGSLVRWIQSAQQSPAFFDVEPLPNVVQVAFNTNHPVHSHLWAVMHPDLAADATPDEVRERLEKAAMAFRVLIYSWARFEEEQTERDRRAVRNARYEWGKYAEEFFEQGDETPPPTDLA